MNLFIFDKVWWDYKQMNSQINIVVHWTCKIEEIQHVVHFEAEMIFTQNCNATSSDS